MLHMYIMISTVYVVAGGSGGTPRGGGNWDASISSWAATIFVIQADTMQASCGLQNWPDTVGSDSRCPLARSRASSSPQSLTKTLKGFQTYTSRIFFVVSFLPTRTPQERSSGVIIIFLDVGSYLAL